jgi:hypothetical protein
LWHTKESREGDSSVRHVSEGRISAWHYQAPQTVKLV